MTTEAIRERQIFVGGLEKPSASGKTLDVYNPATGKLLARVSAGDAEDIDIAVRAARQALEGPWGRMSPTERGKLLYRIAELIASNAEHLAKLDCNDAGRLLTDVRHKDLPRCINLFEFYGGLADKIHGSTYPTVDELLVFSLREPCGVVGAIIPWNAPMPGACGKIAPALACGNTVVLKPAELAPLSSLALGRICHEAGLPDGVLNIVPGYGNTAGAALVNHPDVDKIAFTGSTKTGRKILEMSSAGVKSVTLELGGKTPNIVFPDADIETSLRAAAFSPFYHAGQICVAGTRLFVERSIEDEFLERLVEKTRHITVGNPGVENTMVGPIISRVQLDKVLDYINLGQEEGAQILIGGSTPNVAGLKGGYYVNPTVFSAVDPSMTIAQEEIFGPVLSVITFDEEDEDGLVAMANGVEYGLAAAIWTKDIRRATRMAKKIQAGTVWINMLGVVHPAVPYGGFKHSGIGVEYGVEAIETYTRLKTVWSNVGDLKIGWP
jgi:acyl-CoA reductase-like NAD-dependent aldehyde dehydrogenase|tara:strand:- start:1823 stop:3310 length:1488 start_codon:yes stop_codon:yes gene_type:complete